MGMRCDRKIIPEACSASQGFDPNGCILLFTPNIHDGFFFLHTIRFLEFDFNHSTRFDVCIRYRPA